MNKKIVKKNLIEKKSFSLNDFKQKNSINGVNKEKELTWVPLSESFHEALSLPGFPRGYNTLFRGYSNTGKSTAIYEGVAGAQKIGDLPIIIETEGNWNWDHARNIGVKFSEIIDENTGEVLDYEGDFILFRGDDLVSRYGKYDYSTSKETTKFLRDEPVIEDVQRLIDEFLEYQRDGDLPRNLVFFWDSIGSLNCFKSVMSKSSNNQWNAGAMETSFKSILNHKIPSSRLEGKPYINTFCAVQKIWLDNENKVIKHKGGEAAFYASRLIVHFGGILTHGTSKLKATALGRDYQFGIEAKVNCVKNQINGVEKQGKIASTPHGYWDPDKIDEYKKMHKQFILEKLQVEYNDSINIEILKDKEELNKEDQNG